VITGGDGRVCDAPQRTTIAAADNAVHDEPVFSRDEEDQCMTSSQTRTNRLRASRSTSGRVSSRHDHATSLLRTAGRNSTRGDHNASPDLSISNRSKHCEIQIGLPLKYSVLTTVAFPNRSEEVKWAV
jgi:hypothetical protein